MKKKFVCKGCLKRQQLCHQSCTDYWQEKREAKELDEKIKAYKKQQYEDISSDYRRKSW